MTKDANKKMEHFRLSEESRCILAELSGFHGINKTAVLEMLLRDANRKMQRENKKNAASPEKE